MLYPLDNSKDDTVPDVNGEEEFEEQNTDDYKSTVRENLHIVYNHSLQFGYRTHC